MQERSEPPTPASHRWAEPSDVAQIVALVERAYRGPASRVGWTTEADLLDGQRTDADEVAALIASETTRLLVAELDGRIIASVLVKAPERPGGAAYVGMFAVEPALQAGGVGRALLAQLEQRVATELGATRVRMTVITQRSELIAWYQRRGYAPTGEREPFPYGQPRFGLPRREDLEFLVLEKPLNGPERARGAV